MRTERNQMATAIIRSHEKRKSSMTLQVSSDLHKRIKVAASEAGVSVKQFLEALLTQALEDRRTQRARRFRPSQELAAKLNMHGEPERWRALAASVKGTLAEDEEDR